ncbi:MAG: hypothetical protein ABIF19_00990 [Planctomycetota bacterium]
MQKRNVSRVLFFVLFFSVGATALSSSILCDDLVQYYRNKELMQDAQKSLDRLESLNADYDALLERLEEDPNLIRRLAPATLGPRHQDANAIYPRATAEQLAAARKALIEESSRQSGASAMPEWLSRCSEPRRRTALLVCGVALILTSFVCFRPARQTDEREE